MQQPKPPTAFVLDADVLIDYWDSDRTILSIVSTKVGQIHVPTPLLEEVEQAGHDECRALGLILYEPTLDNLGEASASRCALSFYDLLGFIIARDNGWVYVTNDKALRRYCEAHNVSCLWGLELLVRLVTLRAILPEDASAIVCLMGQNNRFITRAILEDFRRKIGL